MKKDKYDRYLTVARNEVNQDGNSCVAPFYELCDRLIAQCREVDAELHTLRNAKARLDKLIDQTRFEGESGWSVTLEWNNTQDFPCVRNGDGELIGYVVMDDARDGVFQGDDSEEDCAVIRRGFYRAIDAIGEEVAS